MREEVFYLVLTSRACIVGVYVWYMYIVGVYMCIAGVYVWYMCIVGVYVW